MALGSAHALGFKLPQNFNRPYFSASITEFWRRWHITLSSWVRDYLYIPMGGSRGAKWQIYRNLIVTMAALGLWHGAGWTYLVFGIYHGVLLSLERAFPFPPWTNQGLPRAARVAWTFTLLCIGLIIFRSQTLASGWLTLTRMFQPLAGATIAPDLLLIALIVIGCIALGHLVGRTRLARALEARVPAPALGVGLAAQFLLIQLLMPSAAQPFIYFQF
jgi:alginate O-acetyltransferase complex protein AlgI